MRELFEAEYNKVDLESLETCGIDDITLERFVLGRGGGSATLGTVAVWTRVMLGCEPSDLSAAYFFLYCKSQGGLMKMRSGRVQGRYVTIKTGAQSIATRLAASLKPESVKLSTSVNAITQISNGVKVKTTSGCVFKAKKAIVAFATPLYKNIAFHPPLPAGKAHLAESTILGHYSKVMLVYSKPWWRQAGLCGASQSVVGPAAATRDTSEDGLDLFRLTGFIAGRPGEKWSLLAPSERKAAVIAQVFQIFGQEDALHPTDYMEQQWASEQWSLGCPCPYTRPGVLTSVGQHIAESHGNVHFVGAETAVQWKGYMEGALTSGMRGASEVIKALEKWE